VGERSSDDLYQVCVTFFFFEMLLFLDTHSMTIRHYFWLNKCSSTVAVFYGRDDVAAYWCPQVMSLFSEVELGMTLSANLRVFFFF
jgi:hypothetical protein